MGWTELQATFPQRESAWYRPVSRSRRISSRLAGERGCPQPVEGRPAAASLPTPGEAPQAGLGVAPAERALDDPGGHATFTARFADGPVEPTLDPPHDWSLSGCLRS